MYKCVACDSCFEAPRKTYETHGLDTPPYEEFFTCPHCRSDFVEEAFLCDICGEYTVDNYIETVRGQIFCENCCTAVRL